VRSEQTAGVSGSDPGPDNRQEILPSLAEGTRQCECLGSDQAERPVTTSNFFRSVLTT